MAYANAVRLIDSTGAAFGVRQVDSGQLRVISKPYLYSIQEGDITGHTAVTKLGYNGDVDNATEDLWTVGGLYVPPASAMQMEVVSSSTDDDGDPVGTGARTLELHYLDNTWAEKSETITLNGTGVVTTTATNILRVQSFHVLTVGSGGVAAGNIDIRHIDNTPVYSRILAGYNRSLNSFWTVPIGKTLYITDFQVAATSLGTNHYGIFTLKSTCNDGVYAAGVWQCKDIAMVQDNTLLIPFAVPFTCPAKTDVKISVISDAAAANVIATGHFSGWYE